MSCSALLRASVCVLLLLVCPAARAQPAPSAYDEALSGALAAHAAGDYATAQNAMERAHALEPSARTLRGLGIIAYAAQRYLAAVAPLESSLSSSVRPLSPALRASVESLLVQTFERLGRLRVWSDPETSSVLLDGAVPVTHGEHELLLAPGDHHLQLEAPERVPYELRLTTVAGTVETLRIVLAERSTPASGPPVVAPGPVVQSPELGRRADAGERPRLRWSPSMRDAAFMGGGALVVAGVGLWLSAWRKFSRLDEACRGSAAGGCTSDEARQRFEHAHIQQLSRAGIALGAVGAATLTLTLTLSLRQRHEQRPLLVSLAPRGLHLQKVF